MRNIWNTFDYLGLKKTLYITAYGEALHNCKTTEKNNMMENENKTGEV